MPSPPPPGLPLDAPPEAIAAAPSPPPPTGGAVFAGFAMPARKKGPLLTSASTLAEAAGEEGEETKYSREMVGELVEGRLDVPSEGPKVISAQGNTFHLGGAQHLRDKIDAHAANEPSVASPAADEQSAAPAQAPAMNEDAAAAQALLDEIRASSSAAIFGATDDERYKRDVATRADATGMEGYASMPIEEFGKAYLRGYDWQEGQGINGKGVAEPIEYVPRPQLLGLGAQPKAPDEGKKNKKFIKPGESREGKKDMIYVDDQGRQRHVKKVGEKLIERGPSGINKGAVVAITSGVHDGLYARVVSSGGLKDNLRLVLKLMNGEEVTVSAAHVRPVRDLQLEKQRPGFTHAQAKQVERAMAEVAEEAAAEWQEDGEGERRREKKHKSHREEREREREHKSEKRDRSFTDGTQGDGRERNHKKHKSHKSHEDRKDPCGGRDRWAPWVRESIRVRVVEKQLSKGKLYNKKGVVVDVSGPDDFSVKMDDSGALIDGLKHAHVVRHTHSYKPTAACI